MTVYAIRRLLAILILTLATFGFTYGPLRADGVHLHAAAQIAPCSSFIGGGPA